MNTQIIISDKIRDLLPPGPPPPLTVKYTPDIKKTLTELLTGTAFPVYIVLFIDNDELERADAALREPRAGELYYRFILMGAGAESGDREMSQDKNILNLSPSPLSPGPFTFLVNKALLEMERECNETKDQKIYQAALLDMKQDHDDMISIGRSLSTEKDPDKLLRLILMLSKKITGADAGSIFLVEEPENGVKQLRFKYSHTFSKNLPYEEFVMPLNTSSIAGYAAVTGKVLNISDVYKLSSQDPVAFNPSFDRAYDYRSKSMLVVPMKNHIDQIIGVIQLINSKEYAGAAAGSSGNEAFEIVLDTPDDYETKVTPFASRYESLMEAVAGQAAIAIENNRMIKQIQNQFEEFVKASVTAIESRDPATSGHSFRVAAICKEMALAVNGEQDGYFRDISFSETAIKELEYAALLHDFGKVYIDLAIFQKAKKLFPRDLDNLMLKLDYLYRSSELEYSMEEARIIQESPISGVAPALEKLKTGRDECLNKIRDVKEKLRSLNEPTVTSTDPEAAIREILAGIGDIRCTDPDGKCIEVITEMEKINLSIRRGSLNPRERKEIESHVTHTYNFVSRIPWPPEFKNIPDIAAKHHEYLDGSGYPAGLKGREIIPIQARMMAIADIYDALSATDRPYKKSIPLEKTLAILEAEAQSERLDSELVKLFIKYRIYEKVSRDSFK